MIADKSINLDTLYKVLFDNEKLELVLRQIWW